MLSRSATAGDVCLQVFAFDTPVAIPDSGSVQSALVIDLQPPRSITDVNLPLLVASHSWISDLEIRLRSPSGTTVTIVNRVCGSEDVLDLALDDEAGLEIPCPPIGGGPYQPSAALAAFDGEDPNGAWTLEVFDRAPFDTGTLDDWGLEFCFAPLGSPLPTISPEASVTPNPTVTAVPAATPSASPAPPTAGASATPTSLAPTTAVPSSTSTAAAPPTAHPRNGLPPRCLGDCDDNGTVTIDELTLGAAIRVGIETLDACPAVDADDDQLVTAEELAEAVDNALTRCPRPDVILQIRPGAVLFDEGETTDELSVEAFNSNGDEVPIELLAIEWISSVPDRVSIEPLAADPSRAAVTALEAMASGVVTARLGNYPEIIAPPVAVMQARLHPEVEMIYDQDVLFPPPNLPDGVRIDPSRIAAFVPADSGGEASFGGFAEAELADLFEVTDDFAVRYPIVLRGEPPAIGQRLLAAGGASIAGIVTAIEQRGEFYLVQVEVVEPFELFQDLAFDFSAEELLENGLLMPFDTSAWEEDEGTGAPTELGGAAGPSGVTIGNYLCRPVGLGIVPTFTQSPAASNTHVGPIWDGSLKIDDFTIEEFYFKVGLLARASFGPEIRLTSGATVRIACDLKDEHRIKQTLPISGPLAVLLAPYVEGLVTIPIRVSYSGGDTSRYGARLGFDYALWTGASYTPATGWTGLCDDWAACSRTNSVAEVIWDEDRSGTQATIEGEVGVFLTADIGVQAGGVIFRTLERIPGLGRLLQATKVLEEKGKVSVLRGRLGPNGIMRWHNASRTAFIEASEAAANVVLQGDVSLRFEALNSFLAKGLGLLGVRSLPLLQFEFFQFAEPFRLLREESLTVNGMPVGSGSNPVQVTVGSPLSVRATVERDFISLSPIQLILETSVHQEFPHRGEIWAGQEMVGSLTRASEFALTGSLQMNQALCARAPATNPLTLKLLAYNRMFHAIETPNFVGKFQLACDNVDQIVIECDRTAFTIGDGPSAAQCTASLDGEARVPAGTRLRWNSTNSGVATIVASGDGLSAVLTARSPGAASITATLVAGATDLVTSNAVGIVVRDATPPMVALTSDSPSTVRPGDTIQVTVRATDEVGVARIRLEATGEAVLNSVQEAECDGQTATACERSFGVQLKSSGFTDLEVTVTATATDGADNQGQSAPLVFTIKDDCPVVSISSPANGATIVPGIDPTLVQVVAGATDPIGVRSFAYSASGPTLVSQVNIPNLPFGDPLPTSPDLRFNFELQPAVDIAKVTERTITISVSATDDENPSCPAETITVVAMADTRPPSVAFQRPAAGGTVNAGEGVTVMGDAVDNLDADTGVREIRFSASGEALKSPASSSTTLSMPERTTSFSFDFAVKEAEDLREIDDKTIRLTVEAFDEAGNSQEETIVVTAIGDLEGECTGRLTAVPSSGYIGDAVVVSVVIDPPLDTEITRVSTTNPGGVFELQPQGGGVFSTTLFFQGTGSFVLSFTAFDAEGMARCSGSIGAESLGQRPGSGSAASDGESLPAGMRR